MLKDRPEFDDGSNGWREPVVLKLQSSKSAKSHAYEPSVLCCLFHHLEKNSFIFLLFHQNLTYIVIIEI